MSKRRHGTVARAPASTAQPSARGGAPASAPAVSWVRLGVAAAAGLLGFLWAGVLPLAGAWELRAVVCGLIVGLVARGAREIVPAAALAVAAALVGVVVACVHAGGPVLVAPSVAESALIAAVAAGVAAATGWACSRGRRSAAALIAVVFVAMLFLYQAGVLPGEPRSKTADFRASLAVEPPAEQYAFDGYIYLRINHLMQAGMPYYDAFLQAFDQDSRLSGSPPGLLNIRQPWIFELWKVLPGQPGAKVWYWFIALVVGTMLAGYGLARRFVEPAAALLAPVALGGYFLMPALTPWFPLSEFWAGCLAVWFLYALVTERWTAGAVLAVAAFSFRELMLILVPVYVIWWVFSRRRREGMAGLVLVIAGPVVLMALHAAWAPVSGQSASGAAHWLQGGFSRLVDALRFSGDLAPQSRWTYLAAPVLAFAGALVARPTWTKALLCAAVAVPVVALTVFSGGLWNNYWGAIAMPAILALTPLAARLWLPSAASLLDAPTAGREHAGGVRVILHLTDSAEYLRAALQAGGEAASDREHTLLVVDDGAGGEAAAHVKALKAEGVMVRRHAASLGPALSAAESAGAALKGAQAGDAVVLVDVACGVSAGTLTAMLAAFDAGADVVVASRLAPGARSGGGVAARWARSAGCRAVSAVFRSLQPVPGLRDYAAPAVLYSAEALRAAPRDAEGCIGCGKGIDVDLVPRIRERVRVCEVPLVAAGGCGFCGGPYGLLQSAGALAKARAATLAKTRP